VFLETFDVTFFNFNGFVSSFSDGPFLFGDEKMIRNCLRKETDACHYIILSNLFATSFLIGRHEIYLCVLCCTSRYILI
jgi:hypothetical protein